MLEPGDMFSGYVVEKLLGKGGMGAVYLVRAPDGEQYAVKVMFPDMADKHPDFRKRFLREGEFARGIRHPNLIAVYKVGVDPATQLHYIVMEYAPGGSVRDRLEKTGRFEIGEAVEIIRQVAYGLTAAHQYGVIHRDIKPDNILFTSDGTPKLADLGVAKFTEGASKTTMTTAGEIIGTPAYMAPEQMMNAHKVDARADIYALGVVFYEMLAGKRPNENDTVLQILAKAVKGIPIPNVRKMRPEVSASLVQVLNVMCAIRADDRFDSSQKLIDVFERLKHEGLDTRLGLRQPSNRRLRRLLPMSLLLGSVAIGLCAAAYDRMATFVEYYGDWVDEWGIPSGRIPIAAKNARQRGHFAFEYRGRSSLFGKRLLRRVTWRGLLGFCESSNDAMEGRRPNVMEFSYDEDGRLAYVDHVTACGRVELRCQYSGKDMRYIDFKLPERNGGVIAAFIPDRYDFDEPDGKDKIDTSRIRRHVVTRDGHGRVSRIEFMTNDSNEPVADSKGFFGRVFERDETGRPSLMYCIDEEGNRAVDEFGVAFVRRTYDADGNFQETEYLDASTNSVLSANGYASVSFEHDGLGRNTRVVYRGVDGRPCLSRREGFAGDETTYKAEGRAFRKMYLGVDGAPIYLNGLGAGEEVEGIDYVDHVPCRIRTTFLGEDGKPRPSRGGYTIVERLFTKEEETERRFFDADGHPVEGESGFHCRRKSYDAFWNLVEVRHYDIAGKVCRNSFEGIAIVNHAFDMSGRVIERRFRDEHENLCKNKYGYAVEKLRYDSHGNLAGLVYLDEAGSPCETSFGYASVRQKFNAAGLLIRWECFSKDGVPPTNGVPVVEYVREKHGWITERRCCDISGALYAGESGIALTKYSYDGRGRRTFIADYSLDGVQKGIAVRSEYDERGCETLREFIGTNGCLTVDKDWGCMRMRMRYDGLNNCIERSFFDENDKPMLNQRTTQTPFGVSRITYSLNSQSGMTECRYYDTNGKPCLCARGYGGTRSFWDSDSRKQTYVEFLGLDGTRRNLPKETWGGGFFGFEMQYDAMGRLVKKMRFDEDYNFVVCGDECGSLNVYDVGGRQIARLHLGADGKPHKTARGEWGWFIPQGEDVDARKRERESIKELKVAEPLFAQGMETIRTRRNRFVEEWKMVRLQKVPKPDSE